MDVIADYANLRAIGREEALNETFPWILFSLHRRDVEQAHKAQLAALAVNAGAAGPLCGSEGQRALQNFLAEQDQLIRHDPFAEEDPSQPTAREIALWEKMEARARAAAHK